MRNTSTKFQFVALAFSLMGVTSAYADDLFYVGPKVGFMQQEITCPASSGSSSSCSTGMALLGGITVGYNLLGKNAQFPMDMGGLSIALEGELANTLTNLQASDKVLDAGGNLVGSYTLTWKIKSQSLYTVFRYDFNDKFFAQARVGRSNYKTTGTATYSGFGGGTTTIDGSSSDTGYGLGGGINFSSSQIRLDLTSGGSKSKLTSVAFAYMLKF